MSIPPRSVASFPIRVTVKAPGAFEAQPDLFLYENGTMRTVTITIKGIGVAPPEAANDKPSS